MHLKKILRRHWLATIILIASLMFMGIYQYIDNTKPDTVNLVNNEIETEAPKPKEIIKNQIEKPAAINNSVNTIQNQETKKITASPKDDPQKIEKENYISVRTLINSKELTVKVAPSSSVYTILAQLNQTGQASFEFKQFSGLGYFVEGINGQKSDTLRGRYWIYYVNGVKAQVGISQYIVKSNDLITWKYEAQE